MKDQNSQNDDRLDELKTFVYGFMDEQKVERVFGEEGYLTRTIREKNVYDLEKIKEILKPIGKWENILEPDEKKVDKLLPSLSDELKEKILSSAKKKKTITLNAKLKKVWTTKRKSKKKRQSSQNDCPTPKYKTQIDPPFNFIYLSLLLALCPPNWWRKAETTWPA